MHANRLGAAGVASLLDSVSGMWQLTALTLTLGGNRLGDAGVAVLAEALNGLQQLNVLELNLTSSAVGPAGFASLSQYAQSFCAATATQFDIESYSLEDFVAVYDPTSSPNFMPTPEQAHSLGAWLCAMGGTGGLKGARSNGPGSDIAYCVVCAPCRPARTPPTGPRREPAASSRDTRPWTRASRPPWLPLPVLPRSRL